MVIQKRLGVFNPRALLVALIAVGMLALASLAVVWISGSSSSGGIATPAATQAFPKGPAERAGSDEASIQRGAAADWQRYAAQVPRSQAPAAAEEEPLPTSGPR